MRLLGVAVWLASITDVLCTCTEVCPTDGPGWRSNLTITEFTPTYVVVEWNEDSVGNTLSYSVRWSEKQQDGSATLRGMGKTLSLTFNITGLMPTQNYSVMVCRVGTLDSSDDCGNCSLCFTTPLIQAPPGVPENVRIQVVGPETITVSWEIPSGEDPADTLEFFILCVESMTGDVVLNVSQANTDRKREDSLTRFNLQPATSYSCSVAASNEFGRGPYSTPVQQTTRARITEPGLLLTVFDTMVMFTRVTESNVGSAGTYTTDQRPLFTSASTVTGLDYHFYRGEVFYSTQGNSLYRVTLDNTTDDLTTSPMPVMTGPDLLLTVSNSSVESLGSVAVDWLFNEVYWLEYTQTGSRIKRSLIAGSSLSDRESFCMLETSTNISHIIVNPVYGYLFWSDGSGLYRAPLSPDTVRANNSTCPTSIPDTDTLIMGEIITFTLESDQIYVFRARECIMRFPYSLSVANVNGENIQDHITLSASGASSLTSFTQRSLLTFPSIQSLTVSNPLTTPLTCAVGSNPGNVTLVGSAATLVRMYRSAQQPLPAPTFPVFDVRVCPSDNEAIISWSAPLFTGTLFSLNAFNDWTYTVEYMQGGFDFQVDTQNTSSLSLTLSGLQSGRLYEFDIVARGPPGSVGVTRLGSALLTRPLVFSTRREATLEMLVATQTGVIGLSVDTSGATNPVCVDTGSQGSIAVTHDSFVDVSYWAIDGGQGKIVLHSDQAGSDDDFIPLITNPFGLRLDWVTRRLFWVQDGSFPGSNEIRSRSVDPRASREIEIFQESASTVSISSTALDALNGFLFWVNGTAISRKSLSGVKYPVCHQPLSTPTALAVDPENSRLYWLTNPVSGGALTINQLEYTATHCAQTVQARELPDITFSSSATVLTYASNTLFIASQVSNEIHTIPADFMSPSSGQRFAVSTLSLSSACSPDTNVIIKDIAFTSNREQPIPMGLSPTQRGLSVATPDTPALPTLGAATNTSTIVIEWSPPSPILSSPLLLYIVDYQLNSGPPMQEHVRASPRLVLTDQQAATMVTIRVTACSVWSCGTPTLNSTFTSPPPAPGQVTNVRVFVYRPLAGEEVLSALVLWDAPVGSVVSEYSITLEQEGVLVPNVYQPTGTERYHSLLTREPITFAVSYFTPNSSMQYSVQLSASNPTGTGPASNPVTFTFTSPNYPRQVLALTSAGEQVVGTEPALVSLPTSIVPSRPVAVDTIAREIYYVSSNHGDRGVLKSSLQGGGLDILLFLENNQDLVAMTYDWVARQLYYAVRTETDNLQFYRLPVLNKNAHTRLFPALEHSLANPATLQLAIDPMQGSLYWTQSTESTVELHYLNLTLTNSVSSTVLSSTTTRRKHQTNLLASLNLSPPLVLDPVTGELLVASREGSIHSCDVDTRTCQVVVDASSLPPANGLPPSSIAVDESRIYWSSSSGVFAMERDNSSVLTTLSTDSTLAVLGLSPGSQLLGPIRCLSPNLREMSVRPIPRVTETTSTTVTLEWEEPELDTSCVGVAFSFPPLTYAVAFGELAFNNPIVGTTFDTRFFVEMLESFTLYYANLATFNVFSIRRSMTDTFLGSDVDDFMTTAGAPDSPISLSFDVLGTARVRLNWTLGAVRGPPAEVRYFIVIERGQTTSVEQTSVTIDSSSGLTPGKEQVVEVLTSNGVFNSSAARVLIPFWSLAPAPTLIMFTNTTFSVDIQLIAPTHEDIRDVAVQYCRVDTDSGPCSCPDGGNRTEFQSASAPSTLMFDIGGLTTFTAFCLQSVARYRSVGGAPAEETAGFGVINRTGAGLPSAPSNIVLSGTFLSWDEPQMINSVGGIETYIIYAYELNDGPHNDSTEVLGSTLAVDLQTHSSLDLEVGVFYDVQVSAINNVGEGPATESVEFQRQMTTVSTFGLGGIIAVSVAGVLLAVICLGFVLFCVWFIRLGRPKEPDVRGMSYMYGPDPELRNLRDAYRHTQAANPHYTWSCEDYVCTDEDLDLLRHNLTREAPQYEPSRIRKSDTIFQSQIQHVVSSIPLSLRIPRSQLRMSNATVGQGESGIVYKGLLMDWKGTPLQGVAVKTLKGLFTLNDVESMVNEITKMQEFYHPHVLSLIGVCLDTGPGVSMVMPFMTNGSLLDYLRRERTNIEITDDDPEKMLEVRKLLLRMCHQIALGMEYLSRQKFIHRDLAARNCMLDSDGSVKVADFGLAEDIHSAGYFRQGEKDHIKLPFPWMALESITDNIFSEKTDVWSYGVTVWEIFSGGRTPYPAVDPMTLAHLLRDGRRLEIPQNTACTPEIFEVMSRCWHESPGERPDFNELCSIMDHNLSLVSGYTELGMMLIKEEEPDIHEYSEALAADDETDSHSDDAQEKTETTVL